MSNRALTDAETYRDVMYELGIGHALYEPDPNGYDHIRVGDVGYVRDGSFIRLFNACFGANDAANKDSILPKRYVPIRTQFCGVRNNLRLDAGIRKSSAVKDISTEAGVTASGGPVPFSAGAEFAFTCHKSRGAMLVTTKSTIVYNAERIGAFKNYIQAQSSALQRLIRDEQLGIRLSDIILVTDCFLTRDWAIMVAKDSNDSSNFGFQLNALDAGVQVSASKYQGSQTRVPLHRWPPDPPSQISHVGKPCDDKVYCDLDVASGEPGRTQCIFLRGYRVKRRGSWFGRKIKAAAGFDDLPKDQLPPPSAPAIRAHDSASEPTVLDESYDDPQAKTDIYSTMFDYIFEHSRAEVAVLHDDVVCRVAADNWRMDNLMSYLETDTSTYAGDAASSPRLGPATLEHNPPGDRRLTTQTLPTTTTTIPRSISPSRLVVSIDIGTSTSCVAVYYFIQGVTLEPVITQVDRWPGQEHRTFDQCVPSVVLYSSTGQAIKCGAEALARAYEDAYRKDEGPDDVHELYLIKYFKMHLHASLMVQSNEFPIEPLPAGIDIRTVYRHFIAYLFEKTKAHLSRLHSTDRWNALWEQVEIVMTHPNRWGIEQQRVLEEAAILAGLITSARAPTGLFFVEEGEAAASFCATHPELRGNLQPRSNIIVCDAGGSTCDISSYKVTRISEDIYVRESALPSCRYAGGVRVDREFECLLRRRLQGVDSLHSIEEMIYDGLYDFPDTIKCKNVAEDMFYPVKVGGRRTTIHSNGKILVKKGLLTLNGWEVQRCFTPSVDDIIGVLRQRFNAENAGRGTWILLTGGFCDSPYLQSRITQEFENNRIIFANPPTGKAVAIGGLKMLIGGGGALMVDRIQRPWSTWMTNFVKRVKNSVGLRPQ